jgi:hypothetical protein
LECLIKQIDENLITNLKKAYNKIKNGRTDADHRILQPSVDEQNYIELFKDCCTDMAVIIKNIVNKLHNF